MISRFTFERGMRTFEVFVDRRWSPKGIKNVEIVSRYAQPLFLEEDDFLKGSDAFALDMLIMKNNYNLLEGKDLLKGIQISSSHLRISLETEIRRLAANARKVYFQDIEINNDDILVTLDGLLLALDHLKIELDPKLPSMIDQLKNSNLKINERLEKLLNILQILEDLIN